MTHPDSEADFFTSIEQSMHTDLAPWRATLIEVFELYLPRIMDAFYKHKKRQADLGDADDRREIGTVMREILLEEWTKLNKAPGRGDLLTATGRGIFQVFGVEDGCFELEITDAAARVIGTVEGFDLQPYIDSAYLALEFEDEDEAKRAAERYQRPFGLHLVLTDVVVEVPDHEPDVLGDKLVYLPLQYPEVTLQVLAA